MFVVLGQFLAFKFSIWVTVIWTVGYANFGNNENFQLPHFAVHQTNDREQISDLIFACNFFLQYQIRLKTLLNFDQKSHLDIKNAKNSNY